MKVIDFVMNVLPYFGSKDFTEKVKVAWARDHDEKAIETLFILRLVSFSADIIRQKKVIVSLQKELERTKGTYLD